MLRIVQEWFADPPVSGGYGRGHYALVFLILALGAMVRFWGLGNVGLHGDEETMAMPAMSILNTGEPLLPSGMYYARALLNIYMMSGSVLLFGESEWSMRFPSAVVGSLAGLAAFFLGRRFLSPQFNIAFVATLTFLPGMIEISQTARMYVFFVTCVIWFAACLFRWERKQTLPALALAMLVWLLALHFHRLAVFVAPLFLFPGLIHQSWKLVFQGGISASLGASVFFWYEDWIAAKYPQSSERPPFEEEELPTFPEDVVFASGDWLFLLPLLLFALVGIWAAIGAAKRGGLVAVLPIGLVAAGLSANALLQYHVGCLLLLFGMLFWLRNPALSRRWLAIALATAIVMVTAHLFLLAQSGEFPGRRIIGALVGEPSVWPILRFLSYAPVAGVVYVVFAALAFWRFTQGQRLPSHFLLFVMGVWIPLLLIGFFTWYMPPRYALGQLGIFILCTYGAIEYLAAGTLSAGSQRNFGRVGAAIMAVLVLAIVNPLEFRQVVNPQYGPYPDHKGAAEYIESLDLPENAILIAEDVLQQAYYLGKIDYSLRPKDDAARFSFVRDGVIYDQYTDAPVLGTGDELRAVLDANGARDLYIIGSGENFVGDERFLRGFGIAEVLESDLLEVVYRGRDGRTLVWKRRS